MERVLNALSALNDRLSQGAVNADEVEHFYPLYTMEAERIIHDQLVGRPRPAAQAASTDLADVFF